MSRGRRARSLALHDRSRIVRKASWLWVLWLVEDVEGLMGVGRCSLRIHCISAKVEQKEAQRVGSRKCRLGSCWCRLVQFVTSDSPKDELSQL